MTRLCIYRNRDRELIYDGDMTDPRVDTSQAPRYVTLDGRDLRVVNTHSEPRYLGLWVA